MLLSTLSTEKDVENLFDALGKTTAFQAQNGLGFRRSPAQPKFELLCDLK